jgi:hypothetical protein
LFRLLLRMYLALFESEPRVSRVTAGHHRVAFRVDGPTFLRFLERLRRFPVFDEEARESSSARVADHDRAYLAYFCVPYGNRYEVTNYDYEETAYRLSASWGEQG